MNKTLFALGLFSVMFMATSVFADDMKSDTTATQSQQVTTGATQGAAMQGGDTTSGTSMNATTADQSGSGAQNGSSAATTDTTGQMQK